MTRVQVTSLIDILGRFVELTLAPFDLLPPFVALTLLSLITGVLLLLVVRFTTPQRFVDRARNRMTSAVYETRLFLNDPGRLVKAQGRLLWWSVAYIGAMLPAFIVAGLPMGLYFLHMDGRYGRMPHSSLDPAIVRVDVAPGIRASEVTLQAPSGVEVAAGPVALDELRQVYWRLNVTGPAVYDLQFTAAGETQKKQLVATHEAPVSQGRASSWAALLQQSTEPPLPAASHFTGITLPHAERSDTWLGMAWWLYWMVVATVAALVLRKPLGVAI